MPPGILGRVSADKLGPNPETMPPPILLLRLGDFTVGEREVSLSCATCRMFAGDCSSSERILLIGDASLGAVPTKASTSEKLSSRLVWRRDAFHKNTPPAHMHIKIKHTATTTATIGPKLSSLLPLLGTWVTCSVMVGVVGVGVDVGVGVGTGA